MIGSFGSQIATNYMTGELLEKYANLDAGHNFPFWDKWDHPPKPQKGKGWEEYPVEDTEEDTNDPKFHELPEEEKNKRRIRLERKKDYGCYFNLCQKECKSCGGTCKKKTKSTCSHPLPFFKDNSTFDEYLAEYKRKKQMRQ